MHIYLVCSGEKKQKNSTVYQNGKCYWHRLEVVQIIQFKLLIVFYFGFQPVVSGRLLITHLCSWLWGKKQKQNSVRWTETRFYSVIIDHGQFRGSYSSQEPLMSRFHYVMKNFEAHDTVDSSLRQVKTCWKIVVKDRICFGGKHLNQLTNRFQQTPCMTVELALPIIIFRKEVFVARDSGKSTAERQKEGWIEIAKKGTHLDVQLIWEKVLCMD